MDIAVRGGRSRTYLVLVLALAHQDSEDRKLCGPRVLL